ncbi:MAG: hypothetical protein Q8R79_01505, partial [Legionellaceae bacterium]|nr:hypothetical protein [Legionellaceae bacterium]
MKNWNKWLLVFIGTFFFSTVVMAEEVSSKYIEYLVQEKNDLTRAINAVNSNIAPTTQAEFQARISQNARWLSLNHAKIISFQASLAHQKSLQQKLTQRIKYLQQNNSSSNADEDAVHITALLEINKKSIEVLEENLVLASRYQTSLLQQETYLKLWLAKAEMHQRLEDIHTQELKLQAVLQALYLSSTHLQQDIQENLSPEVTANHYVSILYNNQLMNLAQYDLSELNLEKKIIHADFALQRNPDIRVLQAITDTYREVILEFSQMKLTLQQMLSTLKDEQLYMTNTVLRQKIDALIRSIKARIETITIKQLTLQKKLEKQEQLLKQQLAARQSFSEYRPESWPYIAQQLANTPIKLSKYTQLLFLKVYDHYVWQDTWPEFLGWGVACSILLFYGFLYV